MHQVPTRIALASSVLVLGSVGTVSAVNLQSAPMPFGAVPGTPSAMTGPELLPAPAAPGPIERVPGAPRASAPTSPSAAAPKAKKPSRSVADELVAIGRAPLKKGTVSVPVRNAEKPARRTVEKVERAAKSHRKTDRQVRRDVEDYNDYTETARDRTEDDTFDRAIDSYQRAAVNHYADQWGGPMARSAMGSYGGYSSPASYRSIGGFGGSDSGYVGKHRAAG
ncbi:hypothetical protein BKA01_007399 [Pseudonocardia eucalypti]|uniref:hypothetical protein n=1 Tax=Pseudonocardia eucalypti TaxID=648755 RepID=UPI0016078C7F|nr:hypothetical protein [Pseudonocardia eucalypti]